MRLIDSHCHLNYDGLAERRDEVLANARAAGVTGFLNISTRQSEWDAVIDNGLSGGLDQPVPIFPRLELAEEEGEVA